VPYFSWKYSHASHHRHTNSVEDDEVFVPATRSSIAQEALADSPLSSTLGLISMLLFGWCALSLLRIGLRSPACPRTHNTPAEFGRCRPLHILFNATGPAKHAKALSKDHFNPFSVLFEDSHRLWVAVSDIGVLAMLAVLYWACTVFGAVNVAFYYGAPYLVVNAHLVLITYLQHTDVYIPKLRAGAFTWLLGALCTVDRSYSWPLDAAFHHIGDTHVAHHLFSSMPWYHAQEATAHLAKFLGAYYLKDRTPIPAAALRAWSNCKFIEDEGDRVFYVSPGGSAVGSGQHKKTN